VRYLGIIIVDLIPKIYDAERMIRILHEDEETEIVQINKPFQNKKGEEEYYDLTKGKYDLTITTGPNFSTKRQEASQSMIEMTQAYPKLAEVGGDIMVRNQDWPGAQELAERLKKMLPPQLQDMGDDEIPPQVQAQIQQMGQMIEHLTEALNKTQDTIDVNKAQIESKERIANLNNQAKIVIEQLKQTGGANMALLVKQMEDISGRLNQLGNNQPVEAEGTAEPGQPEEQPAAPMADPMAAPQPGAMPPGTP